MGVPTGRSISGRDTCRKLQGFPVVSARASSVLTTSYGTAATCAARSACGRRAQKGRMMATRSPEKNWKDLEQLRLTASWVILQRYVPLCSDRFDKSMKSRGQ